MADKLKGYAAAKREILPKVEHRQSRYLDNRAEVSHQPTRQQERQMQRFLAAHSRIHSHFQLRRHLTSAAEHRSNRDTTFGIWEQVARTSVIG